ncbi:hypothetical protein Tco_1284251 [Tanacetum coccineum]
MVTICEFASQSLIPFEVMDNLAIEYTPLISFDFHGRPETRSTTSTRNVHYVRECELSHVDVLGEGLYGEGLRFVVVKRSDEDDNGDKKGLIG